MRAAIQKKATKAIPGQLPAKNPVMPARLNPSKLSTWAKTLPIQTSLKVNTPGDRYEQEADRIAGQVMRMPNPAPNIGVQRKTCACGKPMGPDGMCEDCKRKQQAKLQRMAADDVPQTAAPPIVDQVLSQPGRPLDGPTRNFMESRLGQNFGRVRVHTNRVAASSAESVRANAYTVGRNIVFNQGQYQPRSANGRQLLAHELTHVIQQQHGRSSAQIQRDDNGGSGSSPTVYICAKDLDTSPVGRHAFFRIGGTGTGNPTISLQPIDSSLGADCWQGVPDRDYPSDFNAEADCDPTPITLECLEREFAAYPIGHYCTWGPNSNTFVGHVARACGVSDPDPSGWTPGIDASPPPSGTFAPDKWTTLSGCETKKCILPGVNDTP